MENVLFALFMLAVGLMMRQVWILSSIWHAFKIMKKRKLGETEIKKFQNFAVETVFSTLCIMTILIGMTLLAIEGLK